MCVLQVFKWDIDISEVKRPLEKLWPVRFVFVVVFKIRRRQTINHVFPLYGAVSTYCRNKYFNMFKVNPIIKTWNFF